MVFTVVHFANVSHATEVVPPATRRSKRRKETTQRILNAAMKLMTEHGYEAFTIARLAGDLGYAVGALYRYFKGKDAILAALQRQVVDVIRDDLTLSGEATDDALTGSDPDRFSALLHIVTGIGTYESLTRRRPTHYRLLALSLGDPRELLADEMVDAGILHPLQDVLAAVAARVVRAQEVGAIDQGDPMQRTIVAWGAIQGVMQLRKLGRFDARLRSRELTDLLLGSLLIGWGADPAVVQTLPARAEPILDGLPHSD